MNNGELNTKLYKKMFAEQENYRNWLLKQPSEEIICHAYEFSIREDLLLALEINNLESSQAAVLLTKSSLMDDLFNKYEKLETEHMETIQFYLAGYADKALQAQRELPVYPYSAGHAKEQGEMDIYCASHRANVACRDAIQAAIAEHYRNSRLEEECVSQVVEQFGYDRMFYVLAFTVREKDKDGRISNANKEWARSIPVIEEKSAANQNYNLDFLVDLCNPGLTNIFINIARRDYLLTQSLTEKDIVQEAERILNKLKEKKNRTAKMERSL